MREVEIELNGYLDVYCPKGFATFTDINCRDTCAWFQILDLAEVEGENKDGPHAYCQDHCIGRIKSGQETTQHAKE